MPYPPSGAARWPTRRHLTWLVPALTLSYFFLSYWLLGFHAEQVVLVVLVNGCYFLSGFTRRLITGFSIFLVFWVLYDYLKLVPNYLVRAVDIAPLYHAEKGLFGIHEQGQLLTPNEYWLLHKQAWLDVLCGLFYLCWVPVPILFAGYLFFTTRRLFLEFALTFLLVNVLGFVLYYLHPAAPPWYVQQHGFAFEPLKLGSTAGLARFDAYFGVSIFQGLYAKNSNVFAAMPSLHSAYPVVVLYYAVKSRANWLTPFFLVVMLGIWFAAVYNSHHYVLDVLAGATTALTGIAVFQLLLAKSPPLRRFLAVYLSAMTPAGAVARPV